MRGMLNKKHVAAGLFCMLLLASCGKQTAESTVSGATGTGNKTNEPVTISAAVPGWIPDDIFQTSIVDQVKRKYPNITVTKVDMPKGTDKYQQLLVQSTPDLIFEAGINVLALQDLGLTADLEPLIKKYNFDISRIDSAVLDSLTNVTGGKTIALPYERNYDGLAYNKDIFDKFGVPYPKDHMTLDDARELAKKLTRMEGGVQYLGLQMDAVHRAVSPLEIPFVDQQSKKKAAVNTEGWQKAFTTLASIYQIPGNSEYLTYNQVQEAFLKEKRLAMFPVKSLSKFEGVTGLNWDLVSYPTFSESSGKGTSLDAHIMTISTASPHKEAAFQAITAVLSDENQANIIKNGFMSVLKDEKFKTAFIDEAPNAKGKHVEAFFMTSPSKLFYETEDGNKIWKLLDTGFEDTINGTKDAVTALRDTNEAINQLLAN